MNQPTVAARAPTAVDVEAGKTCNWCSCGRARTQPWCSGARPLCDRTYKTLS